MYMSTHVQYVCTVYIKTWAWWLDSPCINTLVVRKAPRPNKQYVQHVATSCTSYLVECGVYLHVHMYKGTLTHVHIYTNSCTQEQRCVCALHTHDKITGTCIYSVGSNYRCTGPTATSQTPTSSRLTHIGTCTCTLVTFNRLHAHVVNANLHVIMHVWLHWITEWTYM